MKWNPIFFLLPLLLQSCATLPEEYIKAYFSLAMVPISIHLECLLEKGIDPKKGHGTYSESFEIKNEKLHLVNFTTPVHPQSNQQKEYIACAKNINEKSDKQIDKIYKEHLSTFQLKKSPYLRRVVGGKIKFDITFDLNKIEINERPK